VVWDGAEVTRLGRGVPQGSPLSPILANYYLHEFDRKLRASKIHCLRYADDFLVLARTPFELEECRRVVEKVLADLDLALSAEKTRTTTFEQCFRFLGAEIESDAILLPFEKPKTPKQPVYVAPVMPAALLRAYRAGSLKAARPFEWSGLRRERPEPGEVRRTKPKRQVLGLLAGAPPSGCLSALRRTIA
jgi:hypothetical protein